MKLIQLSAVAVLLLASCSNPDDDNPVEPVVITLDPGLKIEFQAVSNGHNWTNLQTGDVITFRYTVENIDIDSIDDTYEIAPAGNNAIFHQIQNTDFALVKAVHHGGIFPITTYQ
ncbi:MAG: hypothetical protein LBJ63_10170 [Prevotellaceae bacterium]|nr:hypothetical protein [Prevotellaceae bacterium]